MKQLKNRLYSENADLQEGVRLNPKFEKIIEEIIDSCKAIRQILHEAEQAASTNAGFFLGGNHQGRARSGVRLVSLSDRKIKQEESKKNMSHLFKFTTKLFLGCFMTIVAIIGIPIGAPMWLPALFGAGKDHYSG